MVTENPGYWGDIYLKSILVANPNILKEDGDVDTKQLDQEFDQLMAKWAARHINDAKIEGEKEGKKEGKKEAVTYIEDLTKNGYSFREALEIVKKSLDADPATGS